MRKIIVFDLDDTLYKEIDFLKSSYRSIAKQIYNNIGINPFNEMMDWYYLKENVFNNLRLKYALTETQDELLVAYRSHFPNLELSSSNQALLERLSSKNDVTLGIITDGRTLTQNNKIKALKLNYFIDIDNIIISEKFGSEKPNPLNYTFFVNKYPDSEYYYIGDNFKKDFICPNKLGWTTIALRDNGQNIHSQKIDVEKTCLPQIIVDDLIEIYSYIFNVP